MSIVLATSCTHFPCMLKNYDKFLARTADKWGVDRFIHLGDVISLDTISFHEKNPSLYSSSEEFALAQKQFKLLTKVSPKWDWLLGNHDCLTARKAATVGLLPQMLKGYNELWDVPWKVHPRYHKLEVEGVLYSHGEAGKGGQQAALKQAKDNFQSTVIGHYHAQAGTSWTANAKDRIFGLSVGSGLDHTKLAMEYSWRFPAKPLIGCGIIIDGKQALFIPMPL